MVKSTLIFIALFTGQASAQYYSPQTYMPLSCSTVWTAECESAARMTEIQTQQEILNSIENQEQQQRLDRLNDSGRPLDHSLLDGFQYK